MEVFEFLRRTLLVVDEIGRANRRDAITGHLGHLPQCLDFLPGMRRRLSGTKGQAFALVARSSREVRRRLPDSFCCTLPTKKETAKGHYWGT